MTITQLLPHTEPVDGIYRASLDLTTGMATAGHRSLVLTLRHGTGRAGWERVAALRDEMPFLDCSPRHPRQVCRVARIARSLPPNAEVVVAHRIDLVNAAAMISVRQRAPVVLHAHNAPPPWLRWRDPLRVPGTRLINRVIVASEYMQEAWATVASPSTAIDVIEYPIDSDFFEPPSLGTRSSARAQFGIDDDRLVLGYFGRIDQDKGVHILAAAAAELARERSVHVLLQGRSNFGVPLAEANRYRELCDASLGQAHRTWLRPARDVRPLIAASNVIAVPSIWAEPSGLTVSEALATGTPVVASRTGGIPAQMPDSPLVALVRPGHATQLAAAIRGVCSVQPTDERRQALRAHVIAQRSLSSVSQRYLSALTQR